MAKQMVASLALVILMMAGSTVVSGQAPNPMYPPCGEYVGQEYYVSKSGYCTLPDGEIMQGGIWAPRNPGQSVTYVVPWQTGSDQSQGRGYGYAAIHGCTGDIVKFVFNGTDTHNLVEIASQPQAPCNFTNAKTWVDPVGPGAVYNLSSPVDAFRNFADSLGDNCMKGKMHIQVIMHRPTTPKYGCYKAGAKLPPGYAYYPNAPPPPPIVGSTGDGVTAAPVPSPSPSPPPPTKSPPPPPPPSPSPPPPPAKSPPPPPAKSPSPPPPAKSPPPPPASPSPPPPTKTPVATTPSPSPPPPPAVSTERPPVTSQQKTYPPCGQYVGVEYYVSKSGYCMLPDGEIMQGGIWAPRNPGQSVTYVVPWQTGSDQSQGKGYGYAAIHGCTGDTIKFVFNGTNTHNLVEIASQPQAPCNFTNAKTWVDPVGPGGVFNLSSPVDAFRNFADSLGDNCMKGKMHIQLVMHRPTTPKYGCYAAGAKLPADFKYFPNAPPSLPATGSTGDGVTAAPIPSPSPPPPPPPSSPPPPPPAKSPPPPPAKSPPPPPAKSPPPPPPAKKPASPPPPSKTPAAKPSPPPPPYTERSPVGGEQDQCQCYC